MLRQTRKVVHGLALGDLEHDAIGGDAVLVHSLEEGAPRVFFEVREALGIHVDEEKVAHALSRRFLEAPLLAGNVQPGHDACPIRRTEQLTEAA
jgi:hypothetical protein